LHKLNSAILPSIICLARSLAVEVFIFGLRKQATEFDYGGHVKVLNRVADILVNEAVTIPAE
jgi:hypothetical protein